MAGYIGTQAVSVNTTSATITGDASIGGNVTLNEGSADVDFRVETNANANAFIIDGGNNTITADSQLIAGLARSNTAGACAFIVDPNDTTVTYGFRIDAATNSFNIDRANSAVNLMSFDANHNVIIANSGGTLSTATAGTSNFRAGVNAGDGILSGGNYNVTVGDEAGTGLTTGDYNTIVGYQAGTGVMVAGANTYVGSQAGKDSTDGYDNTAIGYGALTANTKGGRCTAVGRNALITQNVTTAGNTNNTAVGYNAGQAVTTGTENVMVGAGAGDSVTTGSNGVYVGLNAGGGTTTAGGGIFIGYNAGAANVSAGASVFIGYNAGETCTAGNNTIIGYRAGEDLVAGNYNTFMGFDCGKETIAGFSNAFYGANTGLTNTGGDKNCIFGSLSDTAAADANSANGLGYDLNCVAGYTTVGDTGDDIRAAHGTATWGTVSDKRVKKDIKDATAGLAFINDLRPVTFNYKNKGDLPENFRGYEEGSTEVYKNSKTQHGFIAQEVKAAIDKHSDIKDGFGMWDDNDDTGQQRVGETAVVPMLVKAIQELYQEIEELKNGK